MKLQIQPPLKNATITQGFGQNFNAYYKASGFLGHSGIDFVSSTSDQIQTSVEGAYTYSFLNKDNPDLSKYRAVLQVIDTDEGTFEISYGHCRDIFCKIGESPLGEIIAKEGNTGSVFTGGVEVTEKEKEAGSTKGTHCHLQLRKVQKVKNVRGGYHYLDGLDGEEFVKDGFYYEIVNHSNGYNGCIDPAPYLVPYIQIPAKPEQTNHFDVPAPIYEKGQVKNWKERFWAIYNNALAFIKNGSTKP